jgi:hypothetical protein
MFIDFSAVSKGTFKALTTACIFGNVPPTIVSRLAFSPSDIDVK